MNPEEQQKLKKDLQTIIIECFKKAKEKKFKDLNFKFPGNITEKKLLDNKLIVLNTLDIYSKTFLSIHTKAKITLREFQSGIFKGDYLELLRLTLTLNDNISKKKSIKVQDKLGLDDLAVGKEITVREQKEIKEEKKKTSSRIKELKNEEIKQKTVMPINGKRNPNLKIINSNMTGKKLQSQINKNNISSELIQGLEI